MGKTQRDEKELLLDHSYDGIQELDNDMPPWWLNLFYVTVVMGIIYLFGYHILGVFTSQTEEFQNEKHEFQELLNKNEQLALKASGSASNIKADIAAGAVIFKTNCVLCHGEQAQGKIGPNLTDNYWLHGGNFESVQHTISEGVPAKGMQSWKSTLGATGVRQAARYVLSLQGSNPANPKEPQGVLYEQVDTAPLAILTDAKDLETGKTSYDNNCAVCHGAKLEGGFASNLHDGVWAMSKGSLEELMKIVTDGDLEKKMPAYHGVLSKKQILEINSYILSMQDKK